MGVEAFSLGVPCLLSSLSLKAPVCCVSPVYNFTRLIPTLLILHWHTTTLLWLTINTFLCIFIEMAPRLAQSMSYYVCVSLCLFVFMSTNLERCGMETSGERAFYELTYDQAVIRSNGHSLKFIWSNSHTDKKKSRIRKTQNLSTDANRSTNTERNIQGFFLFRGIWLSGGGLLCTLEQSTGQHFCP